MIQGLGSFVLWGLRFGYGWCVYVDRYADEPDHPGSEHTDSQPGVPAYTLTLIADE